MNQEITDGHTKGTQANLTTIPMEGWLGRAKAQLQTRAGHTEVRSGPTGAWGTTGPVSLPVCLGWLRVLAVWAICKRVIYR